MASDAVPAGGDPRRVLADVREMARRVRLAQRVTWLPLLLLGLVTLGAILVYRFTDPVLSECRQLSDGQICKVWYRSAQIYWLSALVLAYLAIAAGYVLVARRRGLGARIRPYVLTGLGLLVVAAAAATTWGALDHPYYPDAPPQFVQFLFRVLDPGGMIGLALLVLAWLERRISLLAFTLVYLLVVLVPINFGWGEGWGSNWQFAPQLAINGGLLLLGALGFAIAGRRAR
ncbi:hypothetical protein ACQP00_00420 [Dactylosporangium sp. CS-047395]|uniref:hypothetical protein n=1 Tax=Dactylosporangium sp. CS-047395 TaxID=3239936 RepID=UPI003D8BCA4B